MQHSKRKRAAPIESAQAALESRVMRLEGVVGTGITEVRGKVHIAVYVKQLTKHLETHIPREFRGFPVVVQPTGEFKAF